MKTLFVSCSIPVEQQRLRWGFPPKELRPSDPTHPVELTNGERVSVDVVAGAEGVGNKRGGDKKGSPERRGAVGEREEGDDNKRKEQDMESASKGKNFTFYIPYVHLYREKLSLVKAFTRILQYYRHPRKLFPRIYV